jgi:glutamine amidotransferase
MIVIVDFNMGNLRSVEKAFHRFGAEVCITDDTKTIEQAEKIVIPGVGHFKAGMEQLKRKDLLPVLQQKTIAEKTPTLGICLGMQLMTSYSEEGHVEGLNWIEGTTKRFHFEKNNTLKVPHIGWNSIVQKTPTPLLKEAGGNAHFYFVHSYYVQVTSFDEVAATTTYGIDFHSAIVKDNIIGVQFHPEKSHDKGMQIIKNFISRY